MASVIGVENRIGEFSNDLRTDDLADAIGEFGICIPCVTSTHRFFSGHQPPDRSGGSVTALGEVRGGRLSGRTKIKFSMAQP